MSHRFTTRLASVALCGCVIAAAGVVSTTPAHALLTEVLPVYPHAGNVNTTNVSVCGNPGVDGSKVHVSIPVQVSPSVVASDGSGNVKDAVVAVPKSLDNFSITVESVVGYKYDKNDDGEDVNPRPVIHKMNLHMPTGEKKTRIVDKATGLSGVVKTTAKAAGFDDGSHRTDDIYDVYDLSTFATVPELEDVENTGEFVENQASVVNYRVEGDLHTDNVDAAPVAVKAGAWRSEKGGESPRSTADSTKNDLSRFDWGHISKLPDYHDKAEMSQVARNVVPGAGVDWGGISANRDGDATHILDDVNPSHSWAEGYTRDFALRSREYYAVQHFVSGMGAKDDGFDMGLVSVRSCDASSPSPSATSADPSASAPNTESATPDPTTPVPTASASSGGASSTSAIPTTTAAVPTMNGSSAAKLSVSSFPAISAMSAVPSRKTTSTPSNDTDSSRGTSSPNLPATGALDR